jgi:CO/xanthine dehydrogenase FAD-binding subunit
MSAFEYLAPADDDELVACLQQARTPVTVIGGGTMVVPEITFGQVVPGTVLDLSRAGLVGISPGDGHVLVGAMTTYRQLCEHDGRAPHLPLLPEVALGITGGPQIRNRGTVGGSAAYGNPSSDVPATLAALEARLRLRSPQGTRTVGTDDFFLGAFRTCRRPDEVLVAIEVPSRPRTAHGYYKLKLSQSSWPIVTAATVVQPDRRLRVAVGGLAAVPVVLQLDRPADASDPDWLGHVRESLEEKVADVGGAWTDVLAEGRYRMRVAPTVISRSVARVAAAEAAHARREQE